MVYRSTTAAGVLNSLEPLEPRQFLAAGDLDPTFGRGGVAVLQFDAASAVDVRSDGKILIGAGRHVLRLNPNGSLDRSFTGDGSLDTGLLEAQTVFMPDGRIVVVGRDGDNQRRVARYN